MTILCRVTEKRSQVNTFFVVIEFGSHRIYFGTVKECQYPSQVLVAPDLPRSSAARGLHSGHITGSVEVMMAGTEGAGKKAAVEAAAQTKSTRLANPPTERDNLIAGTSTAPPATPLQAAMSVLATPIAHNTDAAVTQAELEAQRQKLLSGAEGIFKAQQELNLTLREYNSAHGFASVSANPPRVAGNRLRGCNPDQDLRREVLSGKSASVSLSMIEEPKYSSPDKTLKAARAAVEACDSLSGDALAKQQARVRELLDMIEAQNAELA
jgi:hypothetical protein